ncbi:DNA-processing protein DprA [Thiomicrorhabdus sp. zzn3]|uniref:DNA-processing protein DprA n=1 Tax=Thiomicrorhabdus sp. zzn3 TaxID=3039775 RepID=UPI002436553B|nr:DNA-processing protein DprA [Thiomicrorhabdus sp. zzn3]MDG6778945.1 DNA-processing protein DprA [Thiomicrorhabdus sp. zzn3]
MSSFADLPTLLPFHFSHFSVKQLQSVQTHFGSLQAARHAGRSEWLATGLAREKQLDQLLNHEMERWVDEALSWAQNDAHALLVMGDEEYPPSLAEIEDAPPLLWVRGRYELLQDPQLAIVGSRHASRQGVNTAKDFARHLSEQGLTITSGLALGIDTAAHEGGLLGIGKTVAVVATGLDRVYPAANKALAHQIAEEGALVSEFPLGTKPMAYHFPKRNRIISGLSLGTLVVEAALQSGSLITARTALEQGREVFAVPGSIHNPQAKGCHQLIRQGAKLVECGQDVLEELAPKIQFSSMPSGAITEREESGSQNRVESGILRFVEYDPISLDELVVISKMPVSEIQSQMLMLELSGEVEALSGARWRRLK